MEREEFDAQLARLKAIAPAPRGDEPERRRVLAEELWRKFGMQPAAFWTRVITHLIDRSNGDFPEFMDFRNALTTIEARDAAVMVMPSAAEESLEAQAAALGPVGAAAALEHDTEKRLPPKIRELLQEIVAAGKAQAQAQEASVKP